MVLRITSNKPPGIVVHLCLMLVACCSLCIILVANLHSQLTGDSHNLELELELNQPRIISNNMKIITQVKPALSSKSSSKSESTACHVVVESRYDFHHEIIESVVRRFPLALDSWNCSKTKPVVFDFSLFQNRFPDKIAYYMGPIPKFLNQTEYWGWKNYFEKRLQYTTVRRPVDGRLAYYNNLIGYDEYPGLHAVIDITCDAMAGYMLQMRKQPYKHCVVHGDTTHLETQPRFADVRKKTCWLSPMQAEGNCHFLPIDLPKFDVPALQGPSTTTKGIHVCVVGTGRDQEDIVRLFSKTPFDKYNIRLSIGSRFLNTEAQLLAKSLGLASRVSFRFEKDYEAFHQFVSTCEVSLLGVGPSNHPDYFPTSRKRKLTGAIPQVVAYNISAVMHQQLEAIYHQHFTAPVEVYTDETFQSRLAAFNRMLDLLAKQKGIV